VSEKTVFWLGGRPGKQGSQKKQPEQDENFSAEIRQTCEAGGYKVRDFVASQGAFGSWLVYLDNDKRRHRVVWNGKAGQILFERKLVQGGWETLCTNPVERRDLSGFVAAVKSVLEDQAPDPA
jgi:hypothetical protein